MLTGKLSDGATGARALKARGGRVLVEEPASAAEPGMPRAALATGCVDFALPADSLAAALVTLVRVPGAASIFQVPLPPWASARADLTGTTRAPRDARRTEP